MTTAESGTVPPSPVAVLNHDFIEGGLLHSYPAVPSEEIHESDVMVAHAYGLRTQTPRVPYITVWRDSARGTAGQRPADDPRPSEILLTAIFGTEPWIAPTGLVEAATQRMFRPEAVVQAKWELDPARGSYDLVRFGVEIRVAYAGGDPDAGFRSTNFAAELDAVDFERVEVIAPEAANDSMSFDVAASVPQRRNRNQPTIEPTITLATQGSAQPIPPWLMH